MSAEKREQLQADGKVRDDGSRVHACPTCGQELPPGVVLGTVAEAETVIVTAEQEV